MFSVPAFQSFRFMVNQSLKACVPTSQCPVCRIYLYTCHQAALRAQVNDKNKFDFFKLKGSRMILVIFRDFVWACLGVCCTCVPIQGLNCIPLSRFLVAMFVCIPKFIYLPFLPICCVSLKFKCYCSTYTTNCVFFTISL